MSDGIRFLLGREPVEFSGFDPQLTVLEWLRTSARRMGTKEGCAEGDCGACTVVLGEIRNNELDYRAYNACILLLASLDGKQLLTVEDLADGALHPVQQAMVEHHGSQCGFCTPGFVMSLFAAYHDHDPKNPPSRGEIDRVLAGNLCRCTGYEPIVAAAREALSDTPGDRFRREADETLRLLQGLQRDDDLQISGNGRTLYQPGSSAALADLLEQHPEATMVAGATDVGLWITKKLHQMRTLIQTTQVRELLELRRNDDEQCLEIGAAVSYTDAMEALTNLYPDMAPMLERLGAIQVRNAGTIGGNIANGSPIGDMPPALIALGARLVLTSSDGSRTLDLEDFFLEYGKQDLRAGEFVEKVLLSYPASAQQFRVYKISKRFDQDISALCGAFSIELENQKVSSVRICFGGMAGIPARANHCEQALLGQSWNEQTVELGRTALDDDFEPISDWRASKEYRALVARNLLTRFYLSTTGVEQAQLDVVASP